MRGTVGMALDWADTGGSQFFITHSPQPHLDGRYTVFGQVVTGMDVVDKLKQWDVIRSVRVWDGVAWIGSDERTSGRRSSTRYKKGGAASAPSSIFREEAIASSPSLRPSSSWLPSLLPSLPSVHPPLQVGLCVRFAAPPAVASAAWHSARGCRLLLRLAARLTWARDAEKWGSLENRPG